MCFFLEKILPRFQVTIRDVASLADVSYQTVSRVINNRKNVSPATRLKVEEAIAELDYRPNAIARSMAKGHTYTLGCISPNLTNYIFARIIESAQTEARRQGFFILTGSASSADKVEPLIDEMLNRRVDGFLVLNPRDDERYLHFLPLIEKGIPVVYLKNTPKDEAVSSVSCDDKTGGYVATQHLLTLGHQSIVTITGPQSEECSQERLAGYHQAFSESGISLNENLSVEGDWSAKSAGKIIQNLLDSGETFSAIFTQNDRMAIGAIRALQDAGLRVPQDISVIGYDDIPLISYFAPPLTTIHQPLDDFGRHGANLLISAVMNKDYKRKQVCLGAQLIQRDSCVEFNRGGDVRI